MTEQQIKNLHVQLDLILRCFENVAIDLDNIEYDDITMTDEDKKEIVKGMSANAYKLGLAVEDLKKQLDKVVADAKKRKAYCELEELLREEEDEQESDTE